MNKYDNNVKFTLGYEALALLGKGMYSNLWAALSELIANGIDARPKSFVKVYIMVPVQSTLVNCNKDQMTCYICRFFINYKLL